jgi:hypothetical protein
LQTINPRYRFKEHLARQPYRSEDADRIVEGLAKAGLAVE